MCGNSKKKREERMLNISEFDGIDNRDGLLSGQGEGAIFTVHSSHGKVGR